MNLAAARIVLRPRGRLEIMDLAFRYVLGEGRGTMVSLALSCILPVFGVTVAARAWLGLPWWAVWALAVLLATLVSGIFTVASGSMLFERTVRAGAVFRDYARRFPSFLVAIVSSRLVVVLGSLLIAPGVVAWVRHTYVPEAVLLERVPFGRAFSRSASLSREGGESAFGLIVGTLAMSVLVAVGTETIVLAILEDVLVVPWHSERLFSDGGSYPALAGFFLSVPWAAASRFLSYIDGRTRQDAWDVQVRLMALGGGAA
jgi:hypothetical protein